MKKIARTVGLSLSALVASGTIYASDAVGPGDSDSKWILGGGLVNYNNIYKGEDSETKIYPNFAYQGDTFFFKNGTLNLSLLKRNKYTFGLTAGGNGNFLSDQSEYVNNPFLTGLMERKNTVEGGFYMNHTSSLGRLNFTMVSDLADKHNGESASLSYVFDFKVGDWNINPSLGLHWMAKDKVNYYYGVSAAESNANRAAYQAGSALNVSAGIRARYDITENVDFNFNTGVSYLDDSIKDSSIVDARNGYYAGFSFNYNF